MTIHFHTGFEGSDYFNPMFASINQSSGPISHTVSATTPNSGVNCLAVDMSTNDTWSTDPGSNTMSYDRASGATAMTIGVALMIPDLTKILLFAVGVRVDGSSVDSLLYAAIEEDGSATIRTNGTLSMTSGTSIGSAPAGTYPADGGWHYVEFHCTIVDAGGIAQLWIDGVKVIDVTSADTWGGSGTIGTGFAPLAQLTTAVSGSAQVLRVDDFYVASGLAGVLGPQVHEALVPTSSVESGGLGSDGNSVDNYLLVDSVSADYVDVTAADRERYGLANRVETGDVNAVTVRAVMERPDVGVIASSLFSLSGATETDKTLVLGGAKRVVESVPMAVDPDTAAAWTTSGVNALTVGVEAA